MPSLLEVFLDPLSLAIIGIYLLLILWEMLFPARRLPAVAYWQIKGIIAFFFFFLLSTYLPLLYASWLPAAALINLGQLPPYLGALIGIILYELGLFLWHLAMHRNQQLWRIFHQMHHSAERLDTFGAFYFSPFDMIGWTLLGTVCFSLIIGLPPAAITTVLLVTNFFSIFQHANIRTPRWLGYIIQRPESHSLHHARGIHQYNYSDLPLIDILFGTFRNPENFKEESGFYQGASQKIGSMLLFRDISEERKPVS